MALHALELDKVRAMNEKQRFEYFIKYAGRIEDSPKLCYAIRVGSKTLMSDDTADLRDKFDEFLGPRVPYKITPARFLHEHGWKRGYPYSRGQRAIWWTKTDDQHSVTQTVAVKQQRKLNQRKAQ